MDSPLQTNLCKGSSKFQEYEGTVHYYHIITFRQIQYVISSSGNPLLLNRSYEKCAAILHQQRSLCWTWIPVFSWRGITILIGINRLLASIDRHFQSLQLNCSPYGCVIYCGPWRCSLRSAVFSSHPWSMWRSSHIKSFTLGGAHDI
jgi:hypothetical protein